MFNQVYHLRRTKMIVYQIAMILCVVSESVGTAALSGIYLPSLSSPIHYPNTQLNKMQCIDYVDQQDGISTPTKGRAMVHNNDIVGIFSYNIFIGISVATIFGSGFFFDLFWPERSESSTVKLAWKISSIVVSFMALADAIALTVIVATRNAFITGVSPSEAQMLFAENGPPNPIYRHNAYCIASTVILWPGVIASFARLVSTLFATLSPTGLTSMKRVHHAQITCPQREIRTQIQDISRGGRKRVTGYAVDRLKWATDYGRCYTTRE